MFTYVEVFFFASNQISLIVWFYSCINRIQTVNVRSIDSTDVKQVVLKCVKFKRIVKRKVQTLIYKILERKPTSYFCTGKNDVFRH